MRKTKLCQPWVTLGKCQFGDRCNFAHGELELKSAEHMRKVRLVHGHMRTFAHTLAIALPRRERVGVLRGSCHQSHRGTVERSSKVLR